MCMFSFQCNELELLACIFLCLFFNRNFTSWIRSLTIWNHGPWASTSASTWWSFSICRSSAFCSLVTTESSFSSTLVTSGDSDSIMFLTVQNSFSSSLSTRCKLSSADLFVSSSLWSKNNCRFWGHHVWRAHAFLTPRGGCNNLCNVISGLAYLESRFLFVFPATCHAPSWGKPFFSQNVVFL